ncbi:unnamed protein product [Ixodes pacificus]
MCFDLFRYTLYPAKLYEHAARQLVLRHTIPQDTSVSGHVSWVRALRFKCKFERSEFVNDGEIASTREKFRRHAAKQDAANGLESAKRVCRQPEKLVDSTEDDYSIEGHIKSMQREMGKESPDTDKLLDGMTRTFAARRHWIAKERPSAQEVLQRFPGLQRAEVSIFLEFQRFGGKSPVQAITAVAQQEMDTVLDMASKKVDKITYEILERADTCSEEDRHLLVTTLALIVTLPRAVREKSSSFLQIMADWFSTHPAVIWDGDLDNLGPCMVQNEDQLLKADHPVHAILVAFCLHWVVDICHQPAAKGLYTLVEHLLGLNVTKATGMVLKTLSAVEK